MAGEAEELDSRTRLRDGIIVADADAVAAVAVVVGGLVLLMCVSGDCSLALA